MRPHCVLMFEFTSHSQRNKVKLLTPVTPLHHCGNCSSRTCCSGSPMAHNGAQTHQVVSLCRIFSHSLLPAEEIRHCALLMLRFGWGGPQLSYHWLVGRLHKVVCLHLLEDWQCANHAQSFCLCKQDDKTQPDVCNKQLGSSTLGAALVISVTGAL